MNRAGQVLDLFTVEHPEWGASAVARELGIAKSQAHELLVSLSGIGLLQRVRPGRYRLGWRVVALSSLLLSTSRLRREAGRVMRTLAGRYGATVQLAVWARGSPICIESYEGGRWGPSPAHPTLGKVLDENARRLGFAYADHFVAAPIVDAEGIVVAALGMSVPGDSPTSEREKFTRAITASASHISRVGLPLIDRTPR